MLLSGDSTIMRRLTQLIIPGFLLTPVLLGAIFVYVPASADDGDVYLPIIIADPTATPRVTPTAAPTSTPAPTPTAQPTPSLSAVCSYNAYNCADFPTQWQAQQVFAYCMAQVGYDIHRLDRDRDGVACESRP